MSETVMSPVSQEIDESLSDSILLSSHSSCSSIQHSQKLLTTEESCSVESMDVVEDEHFWASDTEADSAVMLLKSLNSESPSSSSVSRRNDNCTIIRLHEELLKSKRNNWEVVDALGKAHEVIRNLRLREQRLNATLSGCAGKNAATNGFVERLNLSESKIIELQLTLRKEEAMKTREDLRAIMEERDRLKEKLGRTESDRRLVLLAKDERERELELSQICVKDLAADVEDKDTKISSVKLKLASLEVQLKDKDSEIEKIRDERNILREAVSRSEQEIEILSEKLQNLMHYKEQHENSLVQTDAGLSQAIQTSHSVEETVSREQSSEAAKQTTLEKDLRSLESRYNQDMGIVHELKFKLQEWESIMKSMNDYVQNTKQQQQLARMEIADLQFLEVSENCSVISKDQDADFEQLNTSSIQKEQMPTIRDDVSVDCCASSQLNETKQSEITHFELNLGQLSDLDKTYGDCDRFETAEGQEDLDLKYCFKSSIEHLIKPDIVRMARITTIDSFVSPRVTEREKNVEDSDIPQRPPRKKRNAKGRKLPEPTSRRLSIDSALSTDSAITQLDDSSSIASFKLQSPRDSVGARRGSHSGSNKRRLPSVPSGEEIIIEGDGEAREPPRVMSIYKPPSRVSDYQKSFGSSEILAGAPVSPRSTRRFNFGNIKKRFSRGNKGSGSKDDIRQEAKKGLFRGKFAILRKRKRKNSIETVSSVSGSFRTVTPLNSECDETNGMSGTRNVSLSLNGIEMVHPSPVRTSTPKCQGRVSHLKRFASEQWRKCLLLIFQHLNPIELCGLGRVCREWRQMSEHPVLWKHVILEDIPLNNMILQAISRKCSGTRVLKLKGLQNIKSREKYSFLDSEDMSCYLERGLELLLTAAGSSLLTLHIEDCGVFISDRCFTLASCHCRELREMIYISDLFPVCPEALWALWGCRKVRTLRVPPLCPCSHPERFNDKSLEMISNGWPNLRQLSVGGPSITSSGLISIAKGCLRLQELELDRAILINEEIAHAMCLSGLRGLETISFTFTPVSPGAIKELLGACPRLERIEVHIGISDYFADVKDEGNIRKYKQIVKTLTALQGENLEFARVLWINADYG